MTLTEHFLYGFFVALFAITLTTIFDVPRRKK